MKTKLSLIFVVLVFLPMFISRCSHEEKGRGIEASSIRPAEAESRLKRTPSGEVVLTLDAKSQKAIGLQVVALTATIIQPEVKGYGRVLDPTPLAALVAEFSAAQAAYQASKAELERLKILAANNNASTRALQAAEAAEARDRSQTDSLRQRLLTSWGSVIAGRSDLPMFAQSLVSLKNALVQIELPAGEFLEFPPAGARLATLVNENKPIESQFVGPAPTINPQTQGQALLFLVKPESGIFVPGAAVIAYLRKAGEPLSGVIVPESAIVRYQEKTWVYVQIDDKTFVRRLVVLNHSVENGWLISEGLKPNERVVISNAQALLSEEFKSQFHIGG